jgi:hypothetical protein
MKIRFLLALVGLAISFALPGFAQQKDTVDPEVRQQIEAFGAGFPRSSSSMHWRGISITGGEGESTPANCMNR